MAAAEVGEAYDSRADKIRQVLEEANSLLKKAKTLADKYYAVVTCLRIVNKFLFSFHLSDHLLGSGEKLMVELVSMRPTKKKVNDFARRVRAMIDELVTIIDSGR